jgi:uncharacterized membrane protein
MADSRRDRLDQPKTSSRLSWDIDPDAFGRFAEAIARFMGTGRFLFWQSMLVVVWIAANVAPLVFHWDNYPFILLNLMFSVQAAYAAPLILLAQNRQADRDRITLQEDRARAERTTADTEFLARELAALRVAIGDVATRDYLRSEMERIRADITTLIEESGAGRQGNEYDAARPDSAS